MLGLAKLLSVIPSLRETWRIVIGIALVAGVVMIFQELIFIILRQRFSVGEVEFPFALSTVTQAGDFTNLLGWGIMLNDTPMLPSRFVQSLLILVLIAISLWRMLSWAPVIMSAGGVANLLELMISGSVLDWIIIPMGSVIKAVSLGDGLILGGAVWCLFSVSVSFLRAIREALSYLRQRRSTTREAS